MSALLAVSVADNWVALGLTVVLVGYLLLVLLVPERF
jgi:K+-transporting ATPase KdpF subunit